MAKLGFRTINEMVGHVDKLKITKAVDHWKAKGLDLTPLLTAPDVPGMCRAIVCRSRTMVSPTFSTTSSIELCKAAIEKGEKVTLDSPIRNINRTTGTVLSSKIAKKYGLGRVAGGYDLDQVLRFGRTIVRGVPCERHHADLEGESNDYIGKGLSGGKIIVFPPKTFFIIRKRRF